MFLGIICFGPFSGELIIFNPHLAAQPKMSLSRAQNSFNAYADDQCRTAPMLTK